MQTDITWIQVAEARALPPGELMGVVVDGRKIAIYNVDGALFATDDVCSHAYALLSTGWLDGDVVECPLHGGCFNVRTGKGLCAPIETDIETFAVRVRDQFIEIAAPSGREG